MKQAKDLLTCGLNFQVLHPQVKEANIFSIVIDGRITALSKMLNAVENPVAVINSKDPEGKTPLFYACYFNFQNIVMYLLMKGADPYIICQQDYNVFHVCAYRGNLECAQIIYHIQRHKLNYQHFEHLKQLMKQYRFKKTDIQAGQLICSDKHLRQTQERFKQFNQEVHDLYQQFLTTLQLQFNKGLSVQDKFNKNPIHYASLSKYTKCLQTTRFLSLYSLNLKAWDFFLNLYQEVQLLDLPTDKKIDPRQYHPFNEIAINFLEKHVQEELRFNLMKTIKTSIKELADQQDNDGFTPMHVASFAGDFAAVQFLLSIGGDPKIKCRKNGHDVLEYASNDMVRKYLIDLKNAAKVGDEKSFQLLVNCGQLIDGKATIYGIAPVHNAIEHTHKSHDQKMLNTILSMEADVNVTDTNGWTPLHHAAFYGEIEAIQSLLDRGANINAFSNRGYFPLHVAAFNNQHEAVKLLHDKGANPNCIDDLGCTALHHAAKKGYPKVIQQLFDLGTDIYSVDQRQWTALHYASFYMHKEVVHQLCRFDCDLDKLQGMRTTKGQLAKDMMTNSEVKFAFETLWKAAKEGNLDIVRKLVVLKHNINEQTYVHRFTPLILATMNNHFLIVKYLLSEKANAQLQDKYGLTAMDYAQKQQNYKIYNLFKE